MERYSLADHKDTHTVISYYKNPSSSPFSSALSPAVLRQKSNSKYKAHDSDAPSLKKPRIRRPESPERNVSLIGSKSQIPSNERQTSGFLPHNPELAEFFASFNGPSDLSLNSPSPPNFDFPPTDDPLKKLLRLLDSPDRTRSPSQTTLEPISLFHDEDSE
jgi:hypothetical protein